MTPHQYLESFVEGNARDCRVDPGDLRRAFNAAISASHLADNYYQYNSRQNPERLADYSSLGDFIEHLARKTSGAFRDIRSISNVYKHLYTGPRHLAHATILSGGAIEAVQSGDPDDTIDQVDAGYEEGDEPGNGRLFVRFTRKDGTTDEFLPVLESFLTYWYQTYAWEDLE